MCNRCDMKYERFEQSQHYRLISQRQEPYWFGQLLINFLPVSVTTVLNKPRWPLHMQSRKHLAYAVQTTNKYVVTCRSFHLDVSHSKRVYRGIGCFNVRVTLPWRRRFCSRFQLSLEKCGRNKMFKSKRERMHKNFVKNIPPTKGCKCCSPNQHKIIILIF